MVSRLLQSIGILSKDNAEDNLPDKKDDTDPPDLDDELEHLDRVPHPEPSVTFAYVPPHRDFGVEAESQGSVTPRGITAEGHIGGNKTATPVKRHNYEMDEKKNSVQAVARVPKPSKVLGDSVTPASTSQFSVGVGDLEVADQPSDQLQISQRPVTRRRNPEYSEVDSLSDVSPIPVGLPRNKNRSTSEHLAQISCPCQITSNGELPFGFAKGNINVDSNSGFPSIPASTSVSTGRVVTASERLIYGISEIQEFVPRPKSTPQLSNLMTVSDQMKANLGTKHAVTKLRNPESPSKAALLLKADLNRRRSLAAPKPTGNQLPPSRRSASASADQSSTRPMSPPSIELQRSSSSSSDIMTKDVDEFKASTLSFNVPLRTNEPSSSQKSSFSILQQLNARVNEIMLEADIEFREKYSQWITQIFHTQLSKMKSKLADQFTQKLEELIEEKDGEITLLHERYQGKLIDFDGASEKFQTWVDSLEDESRQIIEKKDCIIEQMQMQIEEAEQNFELQLEKQQSYLKAEAEREKMELVNRHEDSLRKMMESRGRLDPMARSQMETLHRIVSSLKSENSELKRSLKDSSTLRSPLLHSQLNDIDIDASDTSDSQFDALSITIGELRKRLNETEREKTAISELHADEIVVLKKHSEQTNIDMAKQLQKAQDTIQLLKKKHDREVKDLKMTMLNQETKYNRTFVELKRKYGHKIENLTLMIDKIQTDLR